MSIFHMLKSGPHTMELELPEEPDRLDELCKEIGIQTPKGSMRTDHYVYALEQVLIYLLEREKERR